MKEVKLNKESKKMMPRPVYNQCLWIVKDYERLVEMNKYISDNMPEGEGDYVYYADSSENLICKAVLDNARFQIKCVEEALSIIPDELRDGIYKNITAGIVFDSVASMNTWKKWKERFIRYLAQKLNLY